MDIIGLPRKRRLPRLFLAGILFGALGASTATAQLVQDPVREQERQRELEQRQADLDRFTPESGIEGPSGEGIPRIGPCFEITEVSITGVTVLTPEEIAAVSSAYIPGCLTGGDIQALMLAVDRAYVERGYITTKTYIEPQNIASGSLVLNVIEGVVEEILLTDEEGVPKEGTRARSRVDSALPTEEGEVFQLRDFEQGLDQMNRLRSVEARLRLEPGEEVGGSRVLLFHKQEDPIRGTVELNEYGSEGTGRSQIVLTVEADDLLAVNDQLRLSYTGASNANAASVSGSVPYGYWSFSYSHDYSEYLVALNDISELFGRTNTSDLELSRLVFRDQSSSASFSGGLQRRHSERFINGGELTPTTEVTLRFGASAIKQIGRSRHFFDASFTRGVGLLDGDPNPSDAEDVPKPRFLKFSASWLGQIPIGEKGLVWVPDLQVQHSKDTLRSGEQIAIGSRSTVRGYDSAVAVGDRGLYLRNDLFFPHYEIPWDDLQMQSFLAFDIGRVWDQVSGDGKSAAGITFGVNADWRRFALSAELSAPLLHQEDPGVDDLIASFRVSAKLF